MTRVCDLVGGFDREYNWVHPGKLVPHRIANKLYTRYIEQDIGQDNICDAMLDLVFWIEDFGVKRL